MIRWSYASLFTCTLCPTDVQASGQFRTSARNVWGHGSLMFTPVAISRNSKVSANGGRISEAEINGVPNPAIVTV
jgi:hypothetical protein